MENKFLIKQPVIFFRGMIYQFLKYLSYSKVYYIHLHSFLQIVRSEIERMKKLVIERVMGMPPITRNIIRMQLHYRANYHPRRESES
jgi:hypothetical protein